LSFDQRRDQSAFGSGRFEIPEGIEERCRIHAHPVSQVTPRARTDLLDGEDTTNSLECKRSGGSQAAVFFTSEASRRRPDREAITSAWCQGDEDIVRDFHRWQSLPEKVHFAFTQFTSSCGREGEGMRAGKIRIHQNQHLVEAFFRDSSQYENWAISGTQTTQARTFEKAGMIRQ
jgi:hypothetical protein